MKLIPLAKNEHAIVDDCMYDFLSIVSWNIQKYKKHGIKYATTRVRSIDKPGFKTIAMHRVIMGIYSGYGIDHINHNGLDNRRENLRFSTTSENAANKRKSQNTSSIYHGVSWAKCVGKWQSSIRKDCVKYSLGYFLSEVQAAIVYDLKAKELHGDFASLNFVNTEEVGK